MNTTDMSKRVMLLCCNYSSNDGLATWTYYIKYCKGAEVTYLSEISPSLPPSMQNCCRKSAVLHRNQTQAVVKWCCFQSQWTGKIWLLDPLLTTQSLLEQCAQSQKELVLNKLCTSDIWNTCSQTTASGCLQDQTLTAAWSFVFKLMPIKYMNCSGFHLFLPLSMSICLSISSSLSLPQHSRSPQSHE